MVELNDKQIFYKIYSKHNKEINKKKNKEIRKLLLSILLTINKLLGANENNDGNTVLKAFQTISLYV